MPRGPASTNDLGPQLGLVAVSLLRPEAGLAKRPRARRVSPWGGMAETSHDSDDEGDDEEEED